MPDLARLESELLRLYPEPWVRQHLESFPADYFTAFTPEEVAQHLELVRALDDEHLVVALAWRADPEPAPAGAAAPAPEDDRWWVEVVGYDAFQFLSTLCDLLTVHGLAIVEGRVFTSHPPPREPSRPSGRRTPFRPGLGPGHGSRLARLGKGDGQEREPDRRPKVVDRFLVRRAEGTDTGGDGTGSASAPAPAIDWAGFEAELQSLARLLRDGRHDEVNHRLISRLAAALRRQRPEDEDSRADAGADANDRPGSGLEPLELTIDPEADPDATLVHVTAPDSFGFLARTASALALCGIMIRRAEIRTDDRDRVDDTLWVTDRAGHKIAAEAQLRTLRLSLILIEHFSSRLHRAVNPEAALVHFSRFATETMARPDWAEEFAALDRPEVLDALLRVLGESDFLWEDYLHTRPEELLPMICNPADWRRRGPSELASELRSALLEVAADDEEGRVALLRRFKDREVFRAGFRAILAGGGASEMLGEELSDAAEVLLQAAWDVAAEALSGRWPRRADGGLVAAALFALGKFGGRELGFGSDLELILVYDDRDVAEAPGAASPGAAFDGLVAALRRLLAGRQGTTFELDFRLRPYGRAGAPATALSAFADYYRDGGPAWGYERQALIKLRPIAGDRTLADAVEALRDRFVYGPEPFDLEAYRRMRRLQVEQRVQPGRINAKFSPGALVDVEYFVQALQIAHGGRDPSLRTPNTQRAIAALADAGVLGPAESEALRTSYRFFRALIDALRVVRGHAQDLSVPPAGSDDFLLLARRMRRADPAALGAELKQTLARVQALTARLEEFLGA